MPVTIRSYPELSRAIRSQVGSSKLRRMSKRKRLDYARSQGWIYNPPVAFGTNTPVTMFESSGKQQIREDGKIVGTLSTPSKTYEERVTGRKRYSERTEKTLRQISEGKIKIPRGQKVSIVGGEVVIGKRTAQAVIEYKRNQAIKRELKRQKTLIQKLNNIKKAGGTISPYISKDLRNISIGIKEAVKQQQNKAVPFKSDFFTRSEKLIINAEKRLKKNNQKFEQEKKRINQLEIGEKARKEALKKVLNEYKEDAKRIIKNLGGFIALGFAKLGLTGLKAADFSKKNIDKVAPELSGLKTFYRGAQLLDKTPKERNEIVRKNLKSIKRKITETDYKKIVLNDIPEAFYSIVDNEVKSFINNPISYAVEIFAFNKLLEGGARLLKVSNKKISTKTAISEGNFLNKAGKEIKYKAKLKINPKGKINLKYSLKPFGKKTINLIKSIRLKPSIVKSISKATPKIIKTSIKSTQKVINTVNKGLTDLKVTHSIAKYNTKLRIRSIPPSVYRAIQKRLRRIKAAIRNSKYSQRLINDLQFIKDDLRRFNLNLKFNIDRFKKRTKKIIKPIKTKLNKIKSLFIDKKATEKIILKNLKKYRLPKRKQILKNLKRFGRPKIYNSGKFKGKFVFENKLTGKLTAYSTFESWYNATVQHGRFLLTTKGKRALRKVLKEKTRSARLKAAKVERIWQKENAIKKLGKQPKATRTITRKEKLKIKKQQYIRSKVKRKRLIRGGVNIYGIDRFFEKEIIEVVSKPTKTTKKINEFIKKAETKKPIKTEGKETKAGKGQVQLLKTKQEVKTTTKQINKVRQIQKQELKLIREVKQIQKTKLKPKLKLIPKIKTKLKLKQKQKQKLVQKISQSLKQIQRLKPKQAQKLKEKVKTILKEKTKLKEKQKLKQKQKQKLKEKLRLKQKTKLKTKLKTKFKPKLKPIKKFEDKKNKKIVEEYIKKAKKLNKGVYLSDLAANLLGEKVTGKKARARLLNPNTVFTGLERRLIV